LITATATLPSAEILPRQGFLMFIDRPSHFMRFLHFFTKSTAIRSALDLTCKNRFHSQKLRHAEWIRWPASVGLGGWWFPPDLAWCRFRHTCWKWRMRGSRNPSSGMQLRLFGRYIKRRGQVVVPHNFARHVGV
jgi:hypothetical protein